MRNRKITEKDLEILKYLGEQTEAKGPTDIGIYFGKKYSQASSYCTESLKRLLDGGYITRFKGKYKIVTTFK